MDARQRAALVAFLIIAHGSGWMLGASLIERDQGAERRSFPTVDSTSPAIRDNPEAARRAHRPRLLSLEPPIDHPMPAQTDRIALCFDSPVSAESLSGDLRLSPRPRGQWVLASPTRLEFLLEAPLPRGSSIELSSAPGGPDLGDAPIRLSVVPIRPVSIELTACDQEWATIAVEYDGMVEALAAREAVLVRATRSQVSSGSIASNASGSQSVPVEIISRERATRHVMRVARSGDHPLIVRAAEPGRDASLPGAIEKSIALPAPFIPLRAVAEACALGEECEITIPFAGGVDPDSIEGAVTTDPAPATSTFVRWGNVIVRGPFEPERPCRITLAPTIRSTDGRLLGRTMEFTATVPLADPSVTLPGGSGQLSSEGGRSVTIEVLDVPEIELTIREVLPEHLCAMLAGLDPVHTTRSVLTQRLAVDAPLHRRTSLRVPLDPLLAGRTHGLFEISVRDPRQRWRRDRATIALSDLAITIKRFDERVLAWITSVREGAPVAGATFRAIGPTGRVMAECTTGEDGVGTVVVPKGHPDGPAFVFTASRGEELSWLQPDRRSWSFEAADDSGRRAPGAVDVLLYAERGVHRPGETIHVTAVVRNDLGMTEGDVPLRIRLRRPDGIVMDEVLVTAPQSLDGITHAAFVTDRAASTGPWRIEAALPGSEDVIASRLIAVEAFVPLRTRTTLEAPALVTNEEAIRASIRGEHLFGGPIRNGPATVTATIRTEPFTDREHPEFVFDAVQASAWGLHDRQNLTLDEQGLATLDIPTKGLLVRSRVRVEGTILDLGGRAVTSASEVMVDPLNAHLGLSLRAIPALEASAPEAPRWRLVDGAGELLSLRGPLHAVLERVEQEWTLEVTNERRSWRPVERVQLVAEWSIASAAPDAPPTSEGSVALPSLAPGRHRLSLQAPEMGLRAAGEFHAVAAGRDPDRSESPSKVAIQVEGAPTAPGATARVSVRTPFAGIALATIEDARVHATHVLALPQGSSTIDLPIPAHLRGDTFVTLSLVRPVDPARTQWLPPRATGCARVPLDLEDVALSVVIEAPADAAPGETIRARVLISDGSLPSAGVLHVWAVDEGALLATGYRAPDPRAHFYGPRALGIRSSDLFGDLLPDVRGPESEIHIGADEAWAHVWRPPTPTTMDATAVLWREAIAVDDRGELLVPLTMPRIDAAMRIIAVAFRGHAFGSAEHVVRVASNLVVQANWPRAMAPGDEAHVPVRVLNRTDTPIRATISGAGLQLPVQTEGEFELLGQAEIAFVATLKATDEGTVDASIAATGHDAAGETLHTVIDVAMPVREPSAIVKESSVHTLAPGARLSLPAGDQTLLTRTLTVGFRPSAALLASTQDLIDYPYGCGEQTASRLVALLAAHRAGSASAAHDEAIAAMIRAGLSRLWAMQREDGLIAMWPGASSGSEWLSVWVGHVIAELQREGIPVEPEFRTALHSALGRLCRRPMSEVADQTARAQVVSALAALGEPPLPWLTLLTERCDDLSVEARIHLASAWAAAGNREEAIRILTDVVVPTGRVLVTSDRISAPMHSAAILLQTLARVDPEDPRTDEIAFALVEHLPNASTLEAAGAILALKALEKARPEGDSARRAFTLNGEPQELGGQCPHRTHADAGGANEIVNIGHGAIVVLVRSEVRRHARTLDPVDAGLKVTRRWLDESGTEIDSRPLRAGELVTVEVSIRSLAAENDPALRGLVIVDALAGGMQIEHPGLLGSAGASKTRTDAAEHVEFHDDRVLIFTSAVPRETTFRYALRAVTPGTYALAPLTAQAMYDPALTSRTVGATLEILP